LARGPLNGSHVGDRRSITSFPAHRFLPRSLRPRQVDGCGPFRAGRVCPGARRGSDADRASRSFVAPHEPTRRLTGANLRAVSLEVRETAPRYFELLEKEREHWWSSDNFTKWKDHYVSEYGRGRYLLELLREYDQRFDPAGAHVLDVGCGDGGVIIALAEAGAICTGLEPSGRSLARASVRAEEHGVNVTLVEGIAERLPFPAGTFDLVILDNVLEHVDDRPLTLQEIHRVLRPGGLLYVVTPKPFALHSLWSDPHYQLTGLVLLPPRLQAWYFERVRGGGPGSFGVGVIPTRRSLLRMLRRTGFRSLVDPRELWVRYVESRVRQPRSIQGGIKARVARYLSGQRWPFANRLARWMWDVLLGSNYVIARREP
jgi:ubiquinone/menaquinone biosynthesis C-methylase UbiE